VNVNRIELAAGDATATIAPDEGALVLSVRKAGHELLAQRRDGPAPVPMFGSFLLAPWVAELSLGRIDFRGQRAQMPPNQGRHAMHGLVVGVPWTVVDRTATTATLERRLDDPWPFGGTVTQEIALDPAGTTFAAEIRAEEDAMPAALGWHPWFACPDPNAVQLRVNADQELELGDETLPTGRILPVSRDTDLRAGPILGDRRIDVVFVGARSPALLQTPAVELAIHFDPQIDNVTVYTYPGSVCIEPWSAWPDAFRTAKDGRPSGAVELEPGESLRRWMRWEWAVRRSGSAA
jgi:galactose mutarotase-like enzyme